MMKTLLSLALISVIFTAVGALTCRTCNDDSCSSQGSQICGSETMCMTVTAIQETSTTRQTKTVTKGCAPSTECSTTGSTRSSVNMGPSKTERSVQCCNTDNCNSATLSVPTPLLNGNKCFFCLNGSRMCRVITRCMGEEDRCFRIDDTNSSSPVFGCATENLCRAAVSFRSLGLVENVGTFSSGLNCCVGSLCNDISGTNTQTAATTASPTQEVQSAATTTYSCCVRHPVIHLLLGLLLMVLS